MNDIETWQKRVRELDDLIMPLRMEQSALREKILAARSTFKVGDVIEWSDGRRGRVIDIISWVGEPAWRVMRIRKDGSEGAKCKVYSYMNPTLVRSSCRPGD